MRTPTTHCTHRWAHNERLDARGKSGNMHFEGMRLYSYATVIAVKYPNQQTVVFASEGIYNSPTTRRHKSQAAQALCNLGYTSIRVDCDSYGNRLDTVSGIRKCHDEMKKTLAKKLNRFVTSRRGVSQGARLSEYNFYRLQCNDVARFLKRKEIGEPVISECVMEEIREAVKKRDLAKAATRERQEKARKAAGLKRLEEEKENAQKWRDYNYDGNTWGWQGTYLRLTADGLVQTSKGVFVPFDDALRLFRLCQIIRAKDDAANEIANATVANYRVRGIDAEGNVTVGCHRLSFEEMKLCFERAKAERLVVED